MDEKQRSAFQHTQQQDSRIKKQEKITFYLTTEQVYKLDDLTHEYRKIRGRRINRNDIIRHLIDRCTIELLAEL
ncbi:MAG TPA: hypothetical protein VEP90_11440 [Methylomirabilota bacterium]|nr:hypothetical protein [Methylomirabilota bacterium]